MLLGCSETGVHTVLKFLAESLSKELTGLIQMQINARTHQDPLTPGTNLSDQIS